ncbi:MAG: homoserine kinase [Actinomycetota bacterium]|nr:homoserine kinase [Actinomycetota bacterium]
MSVRVRVPASTANLGSGFDALGLALGLYDVIEVDEVDSGLEVSVSGQGEGEVPLDESHLVVRALRAASDLIGYRPSGLVLRCVNTIPHSRGLGSSAAAIVGGIAAAYGLAGKALDDDALHLAAEFEGHADNVAASLFGGLVIAWAQDGRFHATGLEPHPDLRPVAIVPAERSDTHVTRGLLPALVPHGDAAFTAGRAALAVHAITARPDLLVPALDDRLHQDYREQAWPSTVRVMRELRAEGIAAAVSGAGPTVLALTMDGALPSSVGLDGFTVLPLDVDRVGVTVNSLS